MRRPSKKPKVQTEPVVETAPESTVNSEKFDVSDVALPSPEEAQWLSENEAIVENLISEAASTGDLPSPPSEEEFQAVVALAPTTDAELAVEAAPEQLRARIADLEVALGYTESAYKKAVEDNIKLSEAVKAKIARGAFLEHGIQTLESSLIALNDQIDTLKSAHAASEELRRRGVVDLEHTVQELTNLRSRTEGTKLWQVIQGAPSNPGRAPRLYVGARSAEEALKLAREKGIDNVANVSLVAENLVI